MADGEFDNGLLTLEPDSDAAPTSQENRERSGPGRIFYAAVGIALFFLFLLMKLPEQRIQNYIQAHIKIQAQRQGYSFQAERISTGIFLGPALKFYNVELKALENDKQALKINYLRIRPHVFSFLPFVSLKKVSFTAELLGGEISGTLGMGDTATLVDLDFDTIGIEKTNLLERYLPVNIASGEINGKIDLLWNSQQPSLSQGSVDLTLNKLSLPAQSLMGFQLPKLSVSTTKIDVAVGEGKVTPRTIELGKDINTDDIVAKVTGDATIDNARTFSPLDKVKLNLKVAFQLSKGVMSSFQFLEAILNPAKGPDGKYTYRIGGSLQNPIPTPGDR